MRNMIVVLVLAVTLIAPVLGVYGQESSTGVSLSLFIDHSKSLDSGALSQTVHRIFVDLKSISEKFHVVKITAYGFQDDAWKARLLFSVNLPDFNFQPMASGNKQYGDVIEVLRKLPGSNLDTVINRSGAQEREKRFAAAESLYKKQLEDSLRGINERKLMPPSNLDTADCTDVNGAMRFAARCDISIVVTDGDESCKPRGCDTCKPRLRVVPPPKSRNVLLVVLVPERGSAKSWQLFDIRTAEIHRVAPWSETISSIDDDYVTAIQRAFQNTRSLFHK